MSKTGKRLIAAAQEAVAIARARNEALEWLEGNPDGYPRSWKQEADDTIRRGYVMYDDDAPPIAGYEALEREGIVARVGIVMNGDQERVHFRLREKHQV